MRCNRDPIAQTVKANEQDRPTLLDKVYSPSPCTHPPCHHPRPPSSTLVHTRARSPLWPLAGPCSHRPPAPAHLGWGGRHLLRYTGPSYASPGRGFMLALPVVHASLVPASPYVMSAHDQLCFTLLFLAPPLLSSPPPARCSVLCPPCTYSHFELWASCHPPDWQRSARPPRLYLTPRRPPAIHTPHHTRPPASAELSHNPATAHTTPTHLSNPFAAFQSSSKTRARANSPARRLCRLSL